MALNGSMSFFCEAKKARCCHMALTARVHVLRMKFQVFADEAGNEVVTVVKPRTQV